MADYSQNRILPLNTSDTAKNINAPLIWPKNRGANKIIAVLSTGIGPHDDLNSQVLTGKNFTLDYNSDPLNYLDGHSAYRGTSMASIIAAINKNDVYTINYFDYVGIASEVKLIIGKIGKNDGSPNSDYNIADGIKWAADWVGPNGETADIILIDYYSTSDNSKIKTAIDNAISAGKKVIVGSGETKSPTGTLVYPGSYSKVISVGGIDSLEDKYSNIDYNEQINFLVPYSSDAIKYSSGWSRWQWENAFGAHVTGAIGAAAVAIMMSAYEEAGTPLNTPEQIIAELPKYCRTGRPELASVYGAGILDFGVSKLPNDVVTSGTVPTEPIESNTMPPTVTVGNVTDNSVELSWNYMPTTGDNVYYHIKRDGAVVREAKDFKTAIDRNGVTDSTTYSYTVAVMKDSQLIVESSPVSVTTLVTQVEETPTEPVIEPNMTPPVITMETVAHDEIAFTWNYTPAVGDDIHYEIKRNGVVFDDNKNLKSSTDTNVQPSTAYNYSVAVYSNNEFVVESAVKAATTLATPPVETNTEYVYVNTGSGGTSLTYGVENNVVKADYGRNAVLAKRFN